MKPSKSDAIAMIFTEFRFFLFFGLVFGVYWALRRNGWRKAWILACSYAFYGAWDWRFLSIIIGSTLVDYVVGLNLANPNASKKARRSLLLMSLSVNLGALAFFKSRLRLAFLLAFGLAKFKPTT
ncbi:MAG: hypothetical protein AAFU53_09585, partial [Cyanobacteria bacterium J06632_3]